VPAFSGSEAPAQPSGTPPSSGGRGNPLAPSDRDTAGEASDDIRDVQADALWNEIGSKPILGSGFGSIAEGYRLGSGYSYELSYLDLLFKTGVIGLLLFVSFPLRLAFDAARARAGSLRPPAAVSRHGAAVPLAVVAGIMLLGATNPYLIASFGLCSLVLMVAWLEPSSQPESPRPS